MLEINYIEDLLEVVLGKYNHNFILKTSDTSLLHSFDRQLNKGVALTDRQHNLLRLKLEIYESQFKKQNIPNWSYALNETRSPLREIDRRKTITIIDRQDIVANNRTHHKLKEGKYIKVRFPFNKKFISKLEKVIRGHKQNEYFHEKNSHEHHFFLTALNCYKVVTQFPDWQTDAIITETSKKVKEIIDKKDDYIPIYKDEEFINIDKTIVDQINTTDKKLIADKSIRYGFYIDEAEPKNLLEQICFRNSPTVLADIKKHSIYEVIEILDYLKRYPMLVCLDKEQSFEQLEDIHRAFNKYIDNKEQSVLFRVESSDKTNAPLNNYVKDNNLNNWVDENTKVVYIKKDKLPKVLLKSEFKPQTAVSKSSLRSNRLVTNYVNFNCDLIVYNDTDLSSFRYQYREDFNSWQLANL